MGEEAYAGFRAAMGAVVTALWVVIAGAVLVAVILQTDRVTPVRVMSPEKTETIPNQPR